MRRWHVPMLVAAFVLAGCGGIEYISQHYSDVSPQDVAMPDDTYGVSDKPAEGRMLVQSSIGTGVAQGIGAGLFSADPLPKPFFQAAAERFLAQTGRKCRITDGYTLAMTSWEFRYVC